METINVIRMLFGKLFNPLTPSVSHDGKQSIDLQSKSIDWFLYLMGNIGR